ncbi:MAG: IS5 family transposase [Betaproteobacteria bacterium]|nr:IS5 family transposase [Betaproteobacteria bacterium]
MRGSSQQQQGLFNYVSPEQMVPKDHPLRRMREWTDVALKAMSGHFTTLYSHTGRPSIAPEKLLRALLLQVFYSIRSERLLIEQLNYNMLFRWFVGLNPDDALWDASTFSKNRDRLVEGDVAQAFLKAVVDQAREVNLISDEHFSVDGTLIEAWSSQKSFRPKEPTDGPPPGEGGRNAEVDFKGETRTNDTHASTTDPDARLYRKGDNQAARLVYAGHVLMENKNGLIVDACVTHASGSAEREAATTMVNRMDGDQPATLGADKAYDVNAFVEDLKAAKVTVHAARNTKNRKSAITDAIAQTPGYAASQRIRKRIEEAFGWGKTVGGIAKTKLRGIAKVDWQLTFTMAGYNLVRMVRLRPDSA